MDKTPKYKRILLKLSGEALQSDNVLGGIDPARLSRISTEIANVAKSGVQVGLVIGGGNLIRGADLYTTGFDRVTADQMGMLATVINGLALHDALRNLGVTAKVLSALSISGLVERYDRWKAIAALEQGAVTIFVGGTGNPLVTTDSAAALRGVETYANIIIKATKVDGVFSADPIKNPKAERYSVLTYDQVLEKRLGVMDLNSILICRDHHMPLRVFNMNKSGDLQRMVCGEDIGTLIQSGDK